MITDFEQVVIHYKSEPHQKAALDWLWQQVGDFVKGEFTQRWRTAPVPKPVAAPAPAPTSDGHKRTNNEGVELIKHFEGFRSSAYICPAGVWTVGYGTTRINGRPVNASDRVSEAQAEDFLRYDLSQFEAAVNRLVTVPLSHNQFAALVSFVYNCGAGAFAGSTLLRLLNAGDYQGAADQFGRWNQGGGVILAGLVRRRQEERALFLKP